MAYSKTIAPIACLILTTLAGCTVGPPVLSPPADAAINPQVTFQTSMGNITIGVYEQMVPLTARRFP